MTRNATLLIDKIRIEHIIGVYYKDINNKRIIYIKPQKFINFLNGNESIAI